MTADGYGRYFDRCVGYADCAHRASYRALVGDIDDGMHVDHLCRVRCCVNPAHLEQITHRENQRRIPADIRARKIAIAVAARHGKPRPGSLVEVAHG